MEPESEPDNGIRGVDAGEAEAEVPAASDVQAEAQSAEPPVSKQELSMLKSALSVIERRQESVPYKELLNEVYTDLLDHNVDFESVRQIEATLLKHVGRELLLLDELDNATGIIVKKWWLGEKAVDAEEGRPLSFWKRLSNKAKPGMPKVRRLLNKWQRQREQPNYQPKKRFEDD